MSVYTQEARIILAIKAIRTTKKITVRKATKIYNVLCTTLRDRINSRTVRTKQRLLTTKLTKLKEKLLSLYILDLDSREFAS